MGSISRVGRRKIAFQSDQFPTLKFFQNGLALDTKGAILGFKVEKGKGGESVMEVGNLTFKITLLKYNKTMLSEGKLRVAHPCSRIMVNLLYFFSEATIKSVRIELKQILFPKQNE
uniref:Uncharacterized protein n=1 Tax=Micrurus corallinus TaxID=54390 RepID=A0A2D4FX19_MICCO